LTLTFERLKEARRGMIKRAGRRLTKRLAEYVGRQGLVPDQPVFDPATFPFLAPMEANWRTIRGELDSLLQLRSKLPSFHEISPDQGYISRGDNWKVFILFGFGEPSQRNCERCPETTRLLRQIPNLRSAWFSILSPRYHIPRHRGVTKTILRAHLGLIVPKERASCVMQVDEERVNWEEGKLLVFDDFFRHEVWNDTDEQRVVLIFDFDRPMKLPGRIVNALLMFAIKRTAFFKDAKRNLKNWDQRLESATQNAEAMEIDD